MCYNILCGGVMMKKMLLCLMMFILYAPLTVSAMEYYKGDSNLPICKYETVYDPALGTYTSINVVVLSSARQSENKIFFDIANVRIYQDGHTLVFGKWTVEMVVEGEHRIRVDNCVFDPDSDSGTDEDAYVESYRDLFWEIDNKIGIRRTGFTADRYTAELNKIHTQPYTQPYYYILTKAHNGNTKSELDEANRLIMTEHKYQKAIAILDAVIKHDKNVSEAYLLRGIAKTNIGEYFKADHDYEEALILEPENPCFYFYRGLNYLMLVKASGNGGQFFGMEAAMNRSFGIEKGEKTFDKALTIAPNYADALFFEAKLLEEQRDLKYNKKALSNYNRLLNLSLQQADNTMVRSHKDALTKRISADEQRQREEHRREQTRDRVNQ